MARTRDDGIAGEDLSLFMHVRDTDGMNLVDPFSVDPVKLYSVDPDKALATVDPLLTLVPEKLSLGTFMVQFPVPITWCPGRYYDKWAVVAAAGQNPLSTTQTFLIRSRSITLDPGTAYLNQEQSPRVTLLTKEAHAGELKQIRFVLSKPLNMPLPPTDIRITTGQALLIDWTPVVREGNEGYLLVQMPSPGWCHHQPIVNSQRYLSPFRGQCNYQPASLPGILRVQFRLQYGDQLYLTPINDLRIMVP